MTALVVGCGLQVDNAESTVEAVRGGRTYSRIDLLFNNAAMACFNWLEDITDEEWDRNRRQEVDLVFYLTRAAWPYLKASRGVIVNTVLNVRWRTRQGHWTSR